ncbi:MAG: acetylxylan esterase [Verrucomicrobia bacterium]|nr:acetylxylan esterase [Verrucomicrobiota bacterium]
MARNRLLRTVVARVGRHTLPVLFLGLLAVVPLAAAESTGEVPPRALPQGQLPKDPRLQPLKDLEGYFPFKPRETPAEWDLRAEQVRRELAVALGLWPMPEKTPLNAVIHGRIDQPDYTVEKVYFESIPGFFVTGNLYRPKGKSGRLPGVLCPHGHWKDGRFTETAAGELRKQIAHGEERFADGGRSALQSRCVQLARMGCVVFHYDMIGYADSVQISEKLAHGFAKQRPEMNAAENWGLFSPQAEAHLESVMSLQTWDSIRALDFLLSLPDVDSGRVAVTGASGGGTQTFVLGALDDRPAVAFPAVMVSTAMQGGCTCENACLLRVDAGNVEIAALFAPKPLGMTAANDWTKEMPTKGFPELQQHFAMLGAPKNVMLKPLLHFGHNYNYVSRSAMYEWLNRHLKLGLPEPVVEEDYHFLTSRELSVWDAQHPKPEGGPELERKLVRWITDRDQKQLAQCQDTLAHFRQVYGGALDVMIGRNLTDAGVPTLALSRRTDRGDYWENVGLLRNAAYGEEIPVTVLEPKQGRPHAVIWADPQGKNGLYARTEQGGYRLAPAIQKLLSRGVTVIGADLLFQGEFLTDDQAVTRTRKVSNPREAAAYSFGYNYTLFAQRVQDLLSVIQYARNHIRGLERLDLVGQTGAGPLAAAAKAQAGPAIQRLAIDAGGFRFAKVTDIHDINFLPGGAKYGDLPGMLALGAPGKLRLAGEGTEVPALVKQVYQLAGAPQNITLTQADPKRDAEAVADWLLGE